MDKILGSFISSLGLDIPIGDSKPMPLLGLVSKVSSVIPRFVYALYAGLMSITYPTPNALKPLPSSVSPPRGVVNIVAIRPPHAALLL